MLNKVCSYSPCLSFPFLEINKDSGLGTFSVQILSLLSLLTPKRAFLPTFMYCLPIAFGDLVPNRDSINFIFVLRLIHVAEKNNLFSRPLIDKIDFTQFNANKTIINPNQSHYFNRTFLINNVC